MGALIPKYGVKPFLYLGSILATLGFLLLSTYTSAEQTEAYLMVYALGSGMLTVSIQNLLVLSIEKSEMALGTSLNTTFRYVGQTLGAPIAGALLSTFVMSYSISGHVLLLPTRTAFQYCFYTSVVAFVAVGLLVMFAREVIGKNAELACYSKLCEIMSIAPLSNVNVRLTTPFSRVLNFHVFHTHGAISTIIVLQTPTAFWLSSSAVIMVATHILEAQLLIA